MTSLRIIQWNCGGLNPSNKSTPLKLGAFDKNFPNASFDIATFVETHHKTDSDFPELIKILNVSHHCIHTPATKDDTFAGIIVLISKHLKVTNSDILIPGRLINFQIDIQGKESEYNFFVFYGQSSRFLNQNLVKRNIEAFSKKIDCEKTNIIIGDFNFCSHDSDRQRDFHTYDRMWKKPWEDFCAQMDLVDPYRIQFPKRKVYSFVSRAGKSRIDRIYVNEEMAQHVIDMKYI